VLESRYMGLLETAHDSPARHGSGCQLVHMAGPQAFKAFKGIKGI
jgi:hypothetical protein